MKQNLQIKLNSYTINNNDKTSALKLTCNQALPISFITQGEEGLSIFSSLSLPVHFPWKKKCLIAGYIKIQFWNPSCSKLLFLKPVKNKFKWKGYIRMKDKFSQHKCWHPKVSCLSVKFHPQGRHTLTCNFWPLNWLDQVWNSQNQCLSPPTWVFKVDQVQETQTWQIH